METYGTVIPIPGHLFSVALQKSELISKVTRDAFRFIYERCEKNIGTAMIVGIAVQQLLAEYESGEHQDVRSAADEAMNNNAKIAEENAARESTRARMQSTVDEAIERFGLERIEKIAANIYARTFVTRKEDVANVGASLYDGRVSENTRRQYLFAASSALLAIEGETK